MLNFTQLTGILATRTSVRSCSKDQDAVSCPLVYKNTQSATEKHKHKGQAEAACMRSRFVKETALVKGLCQQDSYWLGDGGR